MVELTGVDWKCVNSDCDGVLGRIIRGELVLNNTRANTDGVNLVVRCPSCGATKCWFAKDRATISAAVDVIKRLLDRASRQTERA